MKQLGPYALAAAAALVIALGSFAAYRNRTFSQAEVARAEAAAEAAARGQKAGPAVIAAAVVLAPEKSARYPFLSHRDAIIGGRTVSLGGPGSPVIHKRLYDAANHCDDHGAFSELSGDSGRVIAAIPTDRGTAVAITQPPSPPEPLPWAILGGLLAIGAVVAYCGITVGGAARTIGLAVGASGLAAPAYIWSGAIPAAAILVIAVAVAALDARGSLRRAARALHEGRIAYAFLSPTLAAMVVIVCVPFVVGLGLGFFDHHRGEWTFVGLDNFAHILSGGGHSLADPLNFWFTVAVTLAWTAVNVILHVTLGVALALVLRKPWLKLRGTFRVLLILPWAIPSYITALIWHGMFQSEYGAINQILATFGLDRVAWFSSWTAAFTANVATNTWLGFPFMMVVALGALQSIPRDLYEAAATDGASAWQKFCHITLPSLRPALGPAVVLGAIWTFNMFNVIYLVSDGQPGGSTNILVTEAYRWAFERGERYGMAAAYATLIFIILAGGTLGIGWLRKRRAR